MTTYANDIVVESYRNYLRRSPEPEGFTFWVNKVIELLTAGKTTNEIEDVLRTEFTNSPEYKALTTQ